MTTTSNKASSSLTKKASVVVTLLLIITIVAGTILTAPSLSMAQQQQQQQQTTTGTGTAAPTTAPLTPEEQREQDRLKRVTTAITQNLEQGQKQINGIVYTPRWSEPVWVQPNSLSLLFVYCLPGEFADSGQEILGGSELEILESYSLAVTADLTGWLMVVQNEHETDRLPAAVGVICASDANDPQTRILSQQEQIEINNIIRQFITIRNTVINNITQVINIINNVTRPPPTNNTGGGGGNTTDPLTVQAQLADIDQEETPVVLFETLTDGGRPPYTCLWDLGDNTTSEECNVSHIYQNLGTYTATATVTDSVGQTASDSTEEFSITNTGVVTPEPLRAQLNLDSTDIPATYRFEANGNGGTPPYTYHWDFGDGQEANVQNTRHTYENPGSYTATLTVTDATGQTASDSTEVIVQPAPPPTTDEPTTANETGGGQ